MNIPEALTPEQAERVRLVLQSVIDRKLSWYHQMLWRVLTTGSTKRNA